MYYRSDPWSSAKVILVVLLLLFVVAVSTAIKLNAYGGDVDCLFIKCVKVIE